MQLKRQSRGHLIAGVVFLAAVGFLLYNFNSVLSAFLESGKALPVRAVQVDGALTHMTRRGIADAVGRIAGGRNIAAVDAGAVRDRILEDPWAAKASVRKKMPDTIIVSVVEHVPAAYWNDKGLYDARQMAVFYPDLRGFNEPLVRLGAFRDNLAPEVYESAVAFIKALSGSNLQMVALYLDQVRCYTLTLSDGTRLILGRGRERGEQRLRRFVAALPDSGIRLEDVSYVDLRYDVGFAVGPKHNSGEGAGETSVQHISE
ncbi:MAG: FtsQ-type POTRA domain-containing protein [Succinivibrio sp.]|nr:FtsQ-type POTRA domain-containing protein [Succinivibrio sp.]